MIIKRNGYYFRFWYSETECKLYREVEGITRTFIMKSSYFYPQYKTIEERLVAEIKHCIEYYAFPICLQINSKYWYLQKNTTFKQLKDCLDADTYDKKADLNIDKIVEKVKEFINKKKIKICDRTVVKVWCNHEYNIKRKVTPEKKIEVIIIRGNGGKE
ncbi:hypothetical protein [uncultured Clostridium sp.]|uniref:hypothetical protein n=1 Tax=uncultured Clostridium sp. TaxID=59620 RepID=UPI0025F1E06B|nr:hypothetical protein [uncultured Clostridium sp.]